MAAHVPDATVNVPHRVRWAVLTAAFSVLALVVASCGSPGATTPTPSGSTLGIGGGLSTAQVEALARSVSAGVGFPVTGGAVSGINVSGIGRATAKPDLAVLSLGVEGFAPTVADARRIAAEAMNGVLRVLRQGGVAEKDIETQFFNIQPEYTFEEVVSREGRRTERRLLGYRVTNAVSVKVRALDTVGTLIDGAAEAAGDAVRLNGLSFTLENGKALEEQARTLAVRDALAKAQLFAREAGARAGKLVSIMEVSGPQFAKADVAVERFAAAAGAPEAPTPIAPGELDVTVVVQAVFAVE